MRWFCSWSCCWHWYWSCEICQSKILCYCNPMHFFLLAHTGCCLDSGSSLSGWMFLHYLLLNSLKSFMRLFARRMRDVSNFFVQLSSSPIPEEEKGFLLIQSCFLLQKLLVLNPFWNWCNTFICVVMLKRIHVW
jgi:hypothetical protein